MNLLALLKSPIAWCAAAALAAILAVATIFHKGEKAGAADVTAVVEHTTNLEIEKARKDKDVADEKVRTTAPDVVIDSTR
jgi:ABC-type transport system involved in cytochrome c biogenesis permease component